jgi:hypothetical protein
MLSEHWQLKPSEHKYHLEANTAFSLRMQLRMSSLFKNLDQQKFMPETGHNWRVFAQK